MKERNMEKKERRARDKDRVEWGSVDEQQHQRTSLQRVCGTLISSNEVDIWLLQSVCVCSRSRSLTLSLSVSPSFS